MNGDLFTQISVYAYKPIGSLKYFNGKTKDSDRDTEDSVNVITDNSN